MRRLRKLVCADFAHADRARARHIAREDGRERSNNVAHYELSMTFSRGLFGGRSRVISKGFRGQASHFDAGATAFPDSLTWHWRLDLETTVKGGSHGPAHGSPSGASARIVRVNEVWSTASHRLLRTSGAEGNAQVPASTSQEGGAKRGQDDNSKDSKR